ncbi:MAG: YraN family protein [Candidatus Omnitrophica bacterium]|nr:YraN family protein [Candidatus Omnitrophota bacterium]
MDNRHNLILGNLGESIAKDYLKKKGYKIIDQNYRTRYAEIDLIAIYRRVLIFIEVRTKIGERFGSPEETLSKKKINKITRNCLAYIYQNGWKKDYRIDAICVVFEENKGLERVSHYKNILF